MIELKTNSTKNIGFFSKVSGFSLLELLIVLTITAILFNLAYPSWLSYWVRAHRVDGQMALFNLAQRMENHFTQHASYVLKEGTSPLLDNPLSPQGWYELSIVKATELHYTIQATPRNTQATQDLSCQSLRLNDQGMQSIGPGPNGYPVGNALDCW